MKECGAKTRAGTPCRRAGLPNGRCRLHGGTNPGAPIKHGRYSKYLPQRLQARFEEAMADAELTSTAAEIAALDVRLSELFERLGSTETSLGWGIAWKLRQEERDAAAPGDRARAKLQLDVVLEAGLKDSQQWSEIASIVEQRRKCAETEHKRMAAAEQFITAKQANVLLAAVVRLVTENVPDPDARKRIALGLVELVGIGDSAGTPSRTGDGAVN